MSHRFAHGNRPLLWPAGIETANREEQPVLSCIQPSLGLPTDSGEQPDKQTPENFSATIYQALGIAKSAVWTDMDGLHHKIYRAEPIAGLM